MANALIATGREDAYSRLTDKQRLFVDYYCGQANCNAHEAARLAGYSIARSGMDNLQNPTVAAAIEERYKQHRFSSAEAINRMIAIARGDHARFIRHDGADLWLDGQGLLDAGLGWMIKKITNGKHGQSIEFLDTQRALETLGKTLGAFREQVDVVHHVAESEQLREALQDRIQQLQAALGPGPDADVIDASYITKD